MNALISLALASAWNRRLTLGLALLSIMLATSLMLSVERLRHQAEHSFAQSVSGTDLIVGARGSAAALTTTKKSKLHSRQSPIDCDHQLKLPPERGSRRGSVKFGKISWPQGPELWASSRKGLLCCIGLFNCSRQLELLSCQSQIN
jgi:hypothetical protein